MAHSPPPPLKSLWREKSSLPAKVFRESLKWAWGSWNVSRGGTYNKEGFGNHVQ